MKFQLPSMKTTGQLLLTLLMSIAVGTGLLTLSYTLPVDKINLNVAQSAYIFQQEGDYPSFDERFTSNRDNFTDALMLKEAAYEGKESAFQKAMLCLRNVLSEGGYDSPAEEMVQFYASPEAGHTTASYATYWHGYLIFLKPMLMFFNYEQIRTFNLYMQLLLILFILALLIIKNNRRLIPAYIVTVLMLRPLVSAYGMQHATMYYVLLIALMLLLLLHERLKIKNRALIFFLLLGAATSYFDYLTYPLVSFGIPATLFIFINRKDKYGDVRVLINLLVCWGIGYVGMWSGKWILATVFTENNVIKAAFESIKFRSGNSYDGNVYTYINTLLKNLYNYLRTPWTIVLLFLAPVEAARFVCRHKNRPIKESVPFIVISLLPLLWYAGTLNHSFIHGWLYTYKEWDVTTFALLALFADRETEDKNRIYR